MTSTASMFRLNPDESSRRSLPSAFGKGTAQHDGTAVKLTGRPQALGALRTVLEKSGYDVELPARGSAVGQGNPETTILVRERERAENRPLRPNHHDPIRIHEALATRTPEQQVDPSTLHIDDVRQQAFLHGRLLRLAKKEFDLLTYFSANPGAALSRESLLRHVWGYDFFGGARTVDVHVKRLRGKLRNSDVRFIETVRSVGYRWEPAPIL